MTNRSAALLDESNHAELHPNPDEEHPDSDSSDNEGYFPDYNPNLKGLRRERTSKLQYKSSSRHVSHRGGRDARHAESRDKHP
jgi:hypothetical protein